MKKQNLSSLVSQIQKAQSHDMAVVCKQGPRHIAVLRNSEPFKPYRVSFIKADGTNLGISMKFESVKAVAQYILDFGWEYVGLKRVVY